jgi:hypothetical protein
VLCAAPHCGSLAVADSLELGFTYIHTYTHIHTQTHTNTYTHAHVHTDTVFCGAQHYVSLATHTQTHTHTHTNTHTHTHTHAHSTTYRSLSASDDVLSIGPERALDLLATGPKSASSSSTLAHVGQFDGKNITVMQGRYGLYLKFGMVNAKLPVHTHTHTHTHR